jgi:hypothetical protein
VLDQLGLITVSNSIELSEASHISDFVSPKRKLMFLTVFLTQQGNDISLVSVQASHFLLTVLL